MATDAFGINSCPYYYYLISTSPKNSVLNVLGWEHGGCGFDPCMVTDNFF